MNRLNLLVPLVALIVAGACGPASAAHVGVGIVVGGPYYYPVVPVPYYYQPGPYYYPPLMVVPAAPPDDYVEQGQVGGTPQMTSGPGPQSGSWYYCDAAKAYYPYVRDCPAGWRPVAPLPGPSN